MPGGYFYGDGGLGALYFPVGTGFPSKLCWNCRFSCTVTKASGCKCIYCNSNGTSKTGYYGKSAFAKSSDSCDGI